MQRSVPHTVEDRLEGLCKPLSRSSRHAAARIRLGRGSEGIERLEAHFQGQAFSPHRHDTYAIGVTLAGVQTFLYRGESRYCLPGQCHFLHPDETHDGASGTDEGFGYRIVYIDPWLVQRALDGEPLPFVADPVVRSTAIARELLSGALDMEDPIDDVRRVDIGVSIASMLAAVTSRCRNRSGPLRMRSLLRVRDLIAARPSVRQTAQRLERVADLDRWTLARQFRSAFGTSPSRFRTMRQLDHARRVMRSGMSLADAALDAGFADQSHMSRMFKRAMG
jgi:AraC-like DNA-binding protein